MRDYVLLHPHSFQRERRGRGREKERESEREKRERAPSDARSSRKFSDRIEAQKKRRLTSG